MTLLTDISPLAIHRIIGRVKDCQPPGLPDFESPLPLRVGDAVYEGSRDVVMVAPTCWLVVDRAPAANAVTDLATSAKFTVVDESGAWRLFQFSDADAGDILAKYCPLNLGAIETGRSCGFVSHLAGHPVIILVDASGRCEILVPRSYTASLLNLIGSDVTIDAVAGAPPSRP